MSSKVDPQCIRNTSLGKYLDADSAAALAALMDMVELDEGGVLVREGEDVHDLFLLVEGALDVTTSAHGHNDLVHTMQPGECAGTRAFVTHAPRVATLSARGSATVYCLAPERIEAIIDDNPRLVYQLMRGLVSATHSNLARMYQQSEQLTNYIMRMHGRY